MHLPRIVSIYLSPHSPTHPPPAQHPGPPAAQPPKLPFFSAAPSPLPSRLPCWQPDSPSPCHPPAPKTHAHHGRLLRIPSPPPAASRASRSSTCPASPLAPPPSRGSPPWRSRVSRPSGAIDAMGRRTDGRGAGAGSGPRRGSYLPAAAAALARRRRRAPQRSASVAPRRRAPLQLLAALWRRLLPARGSPPWCSRVSRHSAASDAWGGMEPPRRSAAPGPQAARGACMAPPCGRAARPRCAAQEGERRRAPPQLQGAPAGAPPPARARAPPPGARPWRQRRALWGQRRALWGQRALWARVRCRGDDLCRCFDALML